jgi:predicted unusual protein kinase regulating ubiquinone biosynthesis (AarF/ABC1/UbiB family)
MVGRVSPTLRDGLRETLIAVGTRDAARLVKSFQMIGVLLPSADLSLLERAEAVAFERFWGKNMSELQKISFQEAREYLGEFRQLIYTCRSRSQNLIPGPGGGDPLRHVPVGSPV